MFKIKRSKSGCFTPKERNEINALVTNMSKLRGYLLTCVCFSTDGYIACEEHEEVLRAAWVEEQELQKQKEKEVCFLLYHEFDNY